MLLNKLLYNLIDEQFNEQLVFHIFVILKLLTRGSLPNVFLQTIIHKLLKRLLTINCIG